jgi:hypothetical protein
LHGLRRLNEDLRLEWPYHAPCSFLQIWMWGLRYIAVQNYSPMAAVHKLCSAKRMFFGLDGIVPLLKSDNAVFFQIRRKIESMGRFCFSLSKPDFLATFQQKRSTTIRRMHSLAWNTGMQPVVRRQWYQLSAQATRLIPLTKCGK